MNNTSMNNTNMNNTNMNIKAISFDFWNTLFYNSNETKRKNIRLDYLMDRVKKYRSASPDEILSAYNKGINEFSSHWKNNHKTFGSGKFLKIVFDSLSLIPSEEDFLEMNSFYENVIINIPPDIIHGVKEIIPALSSEYKLGIISDTFLSPGKALRVILKKHGLFSYFSSFVFSDETGYAKPRIEQFNRSENLLKIKLSETCHIGDLEDTDIKGAKAAGSIAGLYLNNGSRPETTEADFVFSDYNELKSKLNCLNI